MKFFDNLAKFIVSARWYFFGIFMALTIASVFLIPMVGVNYDMTKYLPENSDTKVALKVMEDEFGASGTASILVENASVDQIEQLKIKIQEVDGVANVVFDSTSTSYYHDNNGLLKVFFENGDYAEETTNAIANIRTVCEEYEVALGGSAVEATTSRNAIGSEMAIILLIAVAIVLLILLLTSRSWLEPLVYLIVIGCAIVLNMGTNLILGEISFITESISTIMLIALEMDYCIVLCSRFREEQEKGLAPVEAMKKALSGSFLAIIASSLTVIAGLVALMFMDFTIGFDIGAVLAKGVFLSIIAVLFFMPSIILMLSRALQKTAHSSFLPKMDKVATFASKTKYVIPALFLCLVVAGVVLQTGVQFSYVVDSAKQGSQLQIETSKIEDTFGKQNSLVVMVTKGDTAREYELYNNIVNIEVNGEKYINSASGIVATQLYTSLSKNDLIKTYGLTEEVVTDIYSKLNRAETENVYVIELLDYLKANSNTISNIATAKQTYVNNVYAQFSAISFGSNSIDLYQNMTPEMAKAGYSLSDTGYATLQAVYAGMNVTTLPNYAVLQILYTQNIDNYQTQLQGLMTSAPFTSLTVAQIVAGQNLPESVVKQIFATFGKTENDTIINAQLIQALHNVNSETNKTIIQTIAETTQTQVTAGIAQAEYARGLFVSENYSRMIFNLNLAVDDEKAVSFINELNTILAESGYENYYIANNTSNMMNTMEVFKTDRIKTDLITIIAILLIVLLTFRSLSIPVILVLTIQGAIWINLGISNLAGESVFFVCYLLAMAIQMGATIDYGILLTDRYTKFRKDHNKVDSLKMALNTSITTVLTSGLILILAAFTIHFVSSTPLISEIGLLIGRGALISVIAILLVLPQLLLLFDKVIEKTTLKQKFFNEKAVATVLPSTETAKENVEIIETTAQKPNKNKKAKKSAKNDEKIAENSNTTQENASNGQEVANSTENVVETKTTDDTTKNEEKATEKTAQEASDTSEQKPEK